MWSGTAISDAVCRERGERTESCHQVTRWMMAGERSREDILPSGEELGRYTSIKHDEHPAHNLNVLPDVFCFL